VVKPLDPALLDDAVTFDLVLTAEDGFVDGGIGSQLAAQLSERTAGAEARPPVRTLGIPWRTSPRPSPTPSWPTSASTAGIARRSGRLLGRSAD